MATAPTIADFRARYPAFAAVADASVQYWLDEGFAEVSAWREVDQPKGALAYAAHKLAETGQGGAIPSGVTGFKSGTFDAQISDGVARRTGFHATTYGREFLDLARRNFAGPRLAWQPPVSL
ncbi:hypothetical protein [Synechococcus phage Yong-M3-232]|nr:hypothetical protein [Synechococcus phage Yong-M3-232]